VFVPQFEYFSQTFRIFLRGSGVLVICCAVWGGGVSHVFVKDGACFFDLVDDRASGGLSDVGLSGCG
jgi:hypothetical protein